MTQNRRIALNILATYGRSLFALACGLFSARWVLMALGHTDFGLYGVVGGLAAFVGFFNGLLAGAIGRYYAFSIGEARVALDPSAALENSRRWFNTALSVHSVVPVCLVLIGYPLGLWAIENFLAIPPERVASCVWVWRCVLLSCFVAMINVPYHAMYVAKQYIAELTIYSFAQTALNTVFFYFMASHPADWLVRYAIWMCFISIAPQLLICLRASVIFPECKIRLAYWWDFSRFKQLGSYAFWQMFGGLGAIFRSQGIAIVVNKYFGANVNAAMSVANQVSAQTQTLTSAMQGAFQPAIASHCGAKEYDQMRAMAFRACKFGMLLVLIFVIPLALELPEVMCLWLKNPPAYVTGLCWCMLAMMLIDKSTVGHMLAVNANGKIAVYQAFLGTGLMTCLPFAWLFAHLGYGPYSAGFAMVISTAICAWGRVYFARSLVKMSAWYWLKKVLLPVLIVIVLTAAVGRLPGRFLSASPGRVVLTTLVCELVFLPLVWFVALDASERTFLASRIKGRFSRK